MAINQEMMFLIYLRAHTVRCVGGQQAHAEGKVVLLVEMGTISYCTKNEHRISVVEGEHGMKCSLQQAKASKF